MGFDRVARVYRLLEGIVYRDALQRARVEHLGRVNNPARVLLLGDGDGRFLQAFLNRAPNAKVDYVEASSRMIAMAKSRIPESAQVCFYQEDAFGFVSDQTYDLVASHFFLDCFAREEIEAIVSLVSARLKGGGKWLMSDFQMPPHGILRRFRARVLLWTMYRFFRMTADLEARELIDPDPILLNAGLRLSERKASNLGFLRADCWEF